MAEFNVRSESVDVEQIMKQIRARIAEKRGQDYTEEQIRELAAVRLEKFLDPKNLRSDLLEQFRKSRPAVRVDSPAVTPPYTFDDQTLFTSHRGPLRSIRRLLQPILKLFFNPNTLNQILHTQAQFNVDLLKREARRKIEFDQSRAEWNALYYEVLHNLVLETTRTGIEVKNLRMRVESLSSRLDFSERRVRALEGVVQYRPEAVRRDQRDHDVETDDTAPRVEGSTAAPAGTMTGGPPPAGEGGAAAGPGSARRKRRRRRGRRGGGQGTPFGAPPGTGAPAPTIPGDAGDAGDGFADQQDDDDDMDEEPQDFSAEAAGPSDDADGGETPSGGGTEPTGRDEAGPDRRDPSSDPDAQ